MELEARLASREAYRHWLTGMHGLHRPFEAAVAARLGRLPGAPRVPRIERDLRALGMSASQIAALPDAPPPALPGDAAAYGALYVLEGSALGGQIIARQAADTLGLTSQAGLAFFSGGGMPSGRRWRRFCHDLDAACTAPDDRTAALTAAKATFAAFDAWFNEGGFEAALSRAA